MTLSPPAPSPRAERLPRLTEVVEWVLPAVPAALSSPLAAEAPASPPSCPVPGPLDPPGAPSWPIDEDALRRQITQAVLTDLQRRIELTLEVRLRELLAPVLARTADRLLHDARSALDGALTDWVEQAVAQELARRRPAPPADGRDA